MIDPTMIKKGIEVAGVVADGVKNVQKGVVPEQKDGSIFDELVKKKAMTGLVESSMSEGFEA